MKLLSIDTSTKNLSLAISDGEKILRYRNVMLNKSLSVSIVPSIKNILAKAGMGLADLEGYAVGLGPGAFTSLRVGLSTIKGLAFATNKPVVGVSSLDVLAMNVKEDGQICVICDARRNMVYACFYEKKDGVLKRKSDYLLTDIVSVLQQIKTETIIIGDGIKVFDEEIQKSKKMKWITLVESNLKLWFPQAKSLAPLVWDRFQKRKFDKVEKLVPLYLYPEDCQVRR